MSEELDNRIDSIDEIKDSPWVTARDIGVDMTSGGCYWYGIR